jgi:hypothetical protein
MKSPLGCIFTPKNKKKHFKGSKFTPRGELILNKLFWHRPVDADVDVNIVLLKDGHVLHAFDDHVAGRAKPGIDLTNQF